MELERQRRGETQSAMGMEKRREAEMSMASGAARAKAEIEAAYTVAMHRPRSVAEAREKLLEACKRSRFAAAARYAKPIGGSKVYGPSIRFAEEAAKAFGNIRTAAETVYEDAEIVKIRISGTDLESNLQHAVEISVRKTVERKQAKQGMEVLGTRENTYGETIYIIAADDDQTHNKVMSQVSKALRTVLLRLVPQDIIEEAMDEIEASMKAEFDRDPSAKRKELADAFKTIGVAARDLELYLKHPLDVLSAHEVSDLRAIYTAIRNNETTWAQVIKNDANEDLEDNTAGAASRLKNKLRKAKDDGKPPVATTESKEEKQVPK